MRQVRCQSGIMGERYFLQEGFENFKEFERFSNMYGLAERAGMKNKALKLWGINPIVESSSVPSDFRVVPEKKWYNGRTKY